MSTRGFIVALIVLAWLGASASTASAGVTVQSDGAPAHTDAETVQVASGGKLARRRPTRPRPGCSTGQRTLPTPATRSPGLDPEAKGGVAKLDDTITLPAAATVQLLVYPQGDRRAHARRGDRLRLRR